MESKQRWQDWVNLILGTWLFFSPYFGFDTAKGIAAWNSYVIGVAVFVFSAIALYMPQAWEEWCNGMIGLWLIAAPFVLAFESHQATTWNDIVVGILVLVSAIWAGAGSVQPPSHPPMEHAHKA